MKQRNRRVAAIHKTLSGPCQAPVLSVVDLARWKKERGTSAIVLPV